MNYQMNGSKLPKVTFGIIVLNGEPFVRYNLRALYPYAHEIIVVEGASRAAAQGATLDGHSIDGTLDILYRFKAEEDLEDKLTIVTAENHGYPNGFWPGEKDEQSRAYAERATGDYLWQVDIDEFYKPEDLMTILDMLCSEPSITQINVPWLNFWGGFDYLVNGLFLLQHDRNLGGGVPRLFKWGPDYQYLTHRPPTVVDANGTDLRKRNWVQGNRLAQKGIYCYHYATVFPESVKRKMKYYQQQGWERLGNFEAWYYGNFCRVQKPFRIHHVSVELSWLRRFNGTHPSQIEALREDIRIGKLSVTERENSELDTLLGSARYTFAVALLGACAPSLLKLQTHCSGLEHMIERCVEMVFSPSLSGVK